MRIFLLILMAYLLFSSACHEKRGASLSVQKTDTNNVKTDDQNSLILKAPVDTFLVAEGRLYIEVFTYANFQPSNGMQNFAVKETKSGRELFRSYPESFYGEEIYRTGEVDDILVYPTYTILTKNPLVINLTFKFRGDFGVEYFEDLVGKVEYDTILLKQGIKNMRFSFLSYTFTNEQGWEVQAHLERITSKCEWTEEQLAVKFSQLENNAQSANPEELAKIAFICFLNGRNPQFRIMIEKFRKILDQPSGIDSSYPFIDYLDNFIVKLSLY